MTEYKKTESNFLKADDIKGLDNVTLILKSEVKDEQTQWGMKPQGQVEVACGDEKNTKTMALNKLMMNGLIDKFGGNTQNWIDKEPFPITTELIKGNEAIVPK